MTLHPDIEQGMQEGAQAFREGIFFPEDDKDWKEEDIITFVQDGLLVSRYRFEKRYEELKGRPALSYLHHVGFVLGYINQAIKSA